MIRNRLSDLMGMEQKKISQVSKDTGIARSTLTPLYYNSSSMIKIETINTLINYFQVDISSFFESTLFDFHFKVKEHGINNSGLKLSVDKDLNYSIDLKLLLDVEIVEGNKKDIVEMVIEHEENYTKVDFFKKYSEKQDGNIIEKLPESLINFEYYFTNEDSKNTFKTYTDRMSIGMKGLLQSQIIDFIKEVYIDYFKEDKSNEKIKFPTISKSEVFKSNVHIGLNEKPTWKYFGTSKSED